MSRNLLLLPAAADGAQRDRALQTNGRGTNPWFGTKLSAEIATRCLVVVVVVSDVMETSSDTV